MLSPCVSQVPAGAVIAQVDRHEADARLDQPPGQQRLLAPVVRAVALAHRGRLARQVEHLLRPAAGHDVDGLLLEAIHGGHRAGQVEVAPQPVELLRSDCRVLTRS